jgi:hypothetical protein
MHIDLLKTVKDCRVCEPCNPVPYQVDFLLIIVFVSWWGMLETKPFRADAFEIISVSVGIAGNPG